mmetsp:Transcript_3699/g.14067  ORF Transcript_3699/g.14067 Transcript_3699/m.14067 type:complete len:202 (-) Transcript_3699:2202-2807(-)
MPLMRKLHNPLKRLQLKFASTSVPSTLANTKLRRAKKSCSTSRTNKLISEKERLRLSRASRITRIDSNILRIEPTRQNAELMRSDRNILKLVLMQDVSVMTLLMKRRSKPNWILCKRRRRSCRAPCPLDQCRTTRRTKRSTESSLKRKKKFLLIVPALKSPFNTGMMPRIRPSSAHSRKSTRISVKSFQISYRTPRQNSCK